MGAFWNNRMNVLREFDLYINIALIENMFRTNFLSSLVFFCFCFFFLFCFFGFFQRWCEKIVKSGDDQGVLKFNKKIVLIAKPKHSITSEIIFVLHLMLMFDLFIWALWDINLCRLFNAKSIFIQINSSISNNSVQHKYRV